MIGAGRFAQTARRRLQCLRSTVEPAVVLQAKVDFFEALVSRNAAAAKRAVEVMNGGRAPPPLTPAERAKLEPRTKAFAKWVWALRERREQEARGVVFPEPTPEAHAAAKVVLERFRRWLAGDDSAGPFE